MNIAVLGPEGTFSETSLKQALTEISFNHTFVKDLGDLIPMIQTGEVDFAWLPWWNSGIGFLSDKNGNEFEQYEAKARLNLINKIYQSYDENANQKYKVEVNQRTVDRVKNSFQ